jgi:hypothetical protein
MPIRNERVPNEPNIVISRATEPLDVVKDSTASMTELNGILANTKGKLYVIADCRGLSPRFSDVVAGMANTARPDSPLHNPRMETVVVADGQIFANMVAWYKQEHYGNLEMQVFQTVEEAIARVKQRM